MFDFWDSEILDVLTSKKIDFLAYLVVPGVLGPFQIDRACRNTPGDLFSALELDSGTKTEKSEKSIL